MDGRGRALDNVFIERLWRSVKYEDVTSGIYTILSDEQRSLRRNCRLYNEERPHQDLDHGTPARVFQGG